MLPDVVLAVLLLVCEMLCCVLRPLWSLQVSFGANIAKFPAGGFLHVTNINDASGKNNPTPGDWAAFGVTPSGKGQVAVLGDTNCLDSSHMVRGACVCVWWLRSMRRGKDRGTTRGTVCVCVFGGGVL